MKIIVQKFGGTSVATPSLRRHVVRHIARAVAEGYRPVVVLSAMGRNGDPYATDTLISLARDNGGTTNGRELDLLLSCGETIAAAITALSLQAAGYPAIALTGPQAGIITDDSYGAARVLRVNTERLTHELQEGKIPVVTGFQGVTAGGDIATLGRGGSDTTAAVLGVALSAEWVEIYTDVDGVKTADPRLVPTAVTLTHMTYAEVVEMAHLGAKVIHPRAVEIVREARVPLKVLSVVGDGGGTLITDGRGQGRTAELKGDRPVVGIAHVLGRAHVVLDIAGAPPETVPGVFRALGDAGISVDMIDVSPEQIRVTIDETLAEKAQEVLGEIGCRPAVRNGFAKVSVVGAGMHGVPGIMARVAAALARIGVAIYQTTDSHANISCLVAAENVGKAVLALHAEFDLENGAQTSSR